MIIASEWQPGAQLHEVFLSLPERVYHDFPFWPGENRATLNAQFSADNPWFEQGKAWTGVIPGQARMAGFIPHHLVSGQKTAFLVFGKPLTICPVMSNCSARWRHGQNSTVSRSYTGRLIFLPLVSTVFA